MRHLACSGNCSPIPAICIMPDDLSCADRVVRTDLMATSNQITDRYLVALARQRGFSLATFDEPLARSFASEPKLVELVR